MAAGSAVAMITANLRFGPGSMNNSTTNGMRAFQCHPGGNREAIVIFSLGVLGMVANLVLMGLILSKRQLRRWSLGLLFHQALVDCARASILIPLGVSIFKCQPVSKCSLVETAFLLLVTVSTVNILTTVLNDLPVFPQADEEEGGATAVPMVLDSPQCVLFGTFMIWFSSITINLGPTFLSGALAANGETSQNSPSCRLVHGPFRHYVLNALWIAVNMICVLLTLYHLYKLRRDLTKANVEAVRVAGLVTTLVSFTGGRGTDSGSSAAAGGGSAVVRVERNGGPMQEHLRMGNYIQHMKLEGLQHVKMFLAITTTYMMFWGPLFLITLVHHPVFGSQLGYEITLHVAYVHAFVNPTLFLLLHRGLRRAAHDVCCSCSSRRRPSPAACRSPPQLPPLLTPPPPPERPTAATYRMGREMMPLGADTRMSSLICPANPMAREEYDYPARVSPHYYSCVARSRSDLDMATVPAWHGGN